MSPQIYRAFNAPKRDQMSWQERWESVDCGLITAWEVGCRMRENESPLAKQAEQGELPVLGWKGGVKKGLKDYTTKRYGTLRYLAQWQGLRGKDLNINLEKEVQLICTGTKQRVIYTSEREKWRQ